MSRLLAVPLLLSFALVAPAAPVTFVSELLVDAPGSDNGRTFVELYGTPSASLDGYHVVGRNGGNGAITHDVDLTGSVIPADGFFVVADANGGVTEVADADLLVASLDFQNGPDAVQLVLDSTVVDAIGYGSFAAGDVFLGEGSAAPQPAAGQSLARLWANVDTDDNAFDFVLLDVPTPGRGPVLETAGDDEPPATTPEPAAWSLALLGSIGLVATGRRRRSCRAARRR